MPRAWKTWCFQPHSLPFHPLPITLPQSELSKTQYMLFMLFLIHVIPLSKRPSVDPHGHKVKSKFLSVNAGPNSFRPPYFSGLFSLQILSLLYILDLPNYLNFPDCTMPFLTSMSLHCCFPVPRMPCPSQFSWKTPVYPSRPSVLTFTSSYKQSLYLEHNSVIAFIPLDCNYLFTIVSSHLEREGPYLPYLVSSSTWPSASYE